MKPLVALFAVSVLFIAPAHGQSQYPKAQIDQVERLNSRCRGGSGDDPATMKACAQRDAAYSRLEKSGWCYDKDRDAGYQQTWQRCARAAAPVATKIDYLTGYVFSKAGRDISPGRQISRDEMIYVLYENVPCSLPIASAQAMDAAEMLQGSKLARACWAKILSPLSDEFTIVTQFGHVENGSLLNFVEARFRGDGTVTAVGPAISQAEYQRRVQNYQRSMR
ncbi:hypothetical protein D9M68_648000 [compost metagenome]